MGGNHGQPHAEDHAVVHHRHGLKPEHAEEGREIAHPLLFQESNQRVDGEGDAEHEPHLERFVVMEARGAHGEDQGCDECGGMALGQPERDGVHRPSRQGPEQQQRELERDGVIAGDGDEGAHDQGRGEQGLHQCETAAKGVEPRTLHQESGLSEQVVEDTPHHDDVVGLQFTHAMQRLTGRRVDRHQTKEQQRHHDVPAQFQWSPPVVSEVRAAAIPAESRPDPSPNSQGGIHTHVALERVGHRPLPRTMRDLAPDAEDDVAGGHQHPPHVA